MGKKLAINTLITLLFTAMPSMAFAHTVLINSSPKAGSQITVTPKQIVLDFADPLLVLKGHLNNYVTLKNPKGQVISGSDVVHNNKLVFTPSSFEKVIGKYLVKYRVSASDGHVVQGKFNFYIK